MVVNDPREMFVEKNKHTPFLATMFQNIGLKAMEAKEMYSDGWFTSMISSKGGRLAIVAERFWRVFWNLVAHVLRLNTTTPHALLTRVYLSSL